MRISNLHSTLLVLSWACAALSAPQAKSAITVIGPGTPITLVTVLTPITVTKKPTVINTVILPTTTSTTSTTPATTTKLTTSTTTTTKPTTSTTTTTKPTTSTTTTAKPTTSTTSVKPTLSTTVLSTTTDKPTPIDTRILFATRTKNLYATITGQPPFPTEYVEGTKLNLTDIQGDILIGMKKQLEVFYFFRINNATAFKKKLHNTLAANITNTKQLIYTSTQPMVALNLAFTYPGLVKLGYGDKLADQPFYDGQWADRGNLADNQPATNWVPQFQGKNIDGVFLIASDKQALLDAQIYYIENLFGFGADITNIYSLQGNIRPAPFEGHEMFGFLDGVGQPAVDGFNVPLPGQQIVQPGAILTGESGDDQAAARPAWAKDGSFMVFRQLKQFVKEWDDYVFQNAPVISGFTQAQSAELLGARMMGRWKSGAPVDLTPWVDNVALANDINQNNNFDFTHPNYDIHTDQFHCPFAAHIRKARPRADLIGIPPNQYGGGGNNDTNVIMRAGIPYGPEPGDCGPSYGGVCDAAAANGKVERGLAFVAYQSQIVKGFQFIQRVWANDPNFAPNKNISPGVDAVIGQNWGASTWMTGADINNPSWNLTLKEFVLSRGGEYFFSPSISAIYNTLSV